MPTVNVAAVGAYLRKLRLNKGLTVTRVAADFGTSEAQIRKIESGKQDTRGSMLIGYCNYLDGSVEDIAALMLAETVSEEYAYELADRQNDRRYRMVAEQPTTYEGE